jgi:Ca-activated chloride channel family protein
LSDLESLSLSELLDRMADIQEPVPVSWTPQTAGWIWLGVVLVIVVAVVIWLLVRRRRANAYRRVARAALDDIGAAETVGPVFAAQVSELLRRTALAVYPRSEVASLYGAEWLGFLDRCYGGDGFSAGAGRALSTAIYDPRAAVDRAALLRLAREWVRRHRRTPTHV